MPPTPVQPRRATATATPTATATTTRRTSKIPSKANRSRTTLAHSHTPRKSVSFVILGRLKFRTWFDSIYPEDVIARGPNKDANTDTIYVCRWCFRYTPNERAYTLHDLACSGRKRGNPPGVKVYGDKRGYEVWEVDGEKEKLFAQNLSLFSRLFLDHKSVFFDVSSFLYYILTFRPPSTPEASPENTSNDNHDDNDRNTKNQRSNTDYHILGYFSKEKLSWDPNNLACILVFPPYQHRQLGQFLIGISYKLSAWEFHGGMLGGPERPLSEMGRRSYLRFWEERLVRFFLLGPSSGHVHVRTGTGTRSATVGRGKVRKRVKRGLERMSVAELGEAVGMLGEDVLVTLKEMGVLEMQREDGCGENEVGVVRKAKVLQWAKKHRVSLVDAVQEDGFVGEVVFTSEEDLQGEEADEVDDEKAENEEDES